MADEQELDVQLGADSAVAQEGQDQESGAEGEGRQPKAQQDVDLDQVPAFRKWKSSMDKRLAQMEKQLSDAARREYEAQQLVHQQRMQGMSELDRANYQVQMMQQQLQQMQHLRELDQLAFEKDQDIRKVAQRKGLAYDELVEALPERFGPMELWEVAEELAEKKGRGRGATASQVDDTVDMGGGRPKGTVGKYQEAYDKARASFNVSEMIEIKEEALRRGIMLKEY